MNRASGSLLGWFALIIVAGCCGFALLGTFPEIGDRFDTGIGHDLHPILSRVVIAVAAIALAVVCGVLTATGVPAIVEQWSLLTHGVTVPGTVVTVSEQVTDGTIGSFAFVRLTRRDGVETVLRAEAWPSLQAGATVPVRYHPRGRATHRIWTPWRPASVVRWLVGIPLTYGFVLAGTAATLAFAYVAYIAIFRGF